MRIVHAAPYCKCAGVTNWLRYLIGATRDQLAWHCWFEKAQSSPYVELSDIARVVLRSEYSLLDYLWLADPDVVVLAYKGVHYKDALKYREDTGTPVVAVLHTRPDAYESLRPYLGQVDGIVCPSHTVADDFEGWDGMERSRVIRHGVMPPAEGLDGYDFYDRLDIPGDAFLVGWAGRLELDKGWKELIRIVKEMWGSRHHFIVAGAGQKSGMAEVAQAAKNYPNLSWVGSVPMNSMPSFYAGLDGGLSTSPYEAFGLVLCEMAWSKLDIVARDGGAVKEVLGDTSWLYRGTSEAINYLDIAANETENASFAWDVLEHVKKNQFTAQRMGNEYVELFQKLKER